MKVAMKLTGTGLILLVAILGCVSSHRGGWGGRPGRRPGGYRPHGGGRPYNGGRPYCKFQSNEEFQNAFTSSGVVPDFIPEAPPQPVTIFQSDRRCLNANDLTSTSALDVKPRFKWPVEEGALYTLLIEDNVLSTRPDSQFGHYLVVNVPGNDVSAGDDVLDYITSFAFELNATGNGLDTETLTQKKHLVLVYKQVGRLEIADDEKHIGCSNNLGNRFAYAHEDIEQRWDLELVAGTFYLITYEEGWSEYWMCYTSTAAGFPFPFPIDGVNDKPQGQCELCEKPARATTNKPCNRPFRGL